MYIHVITLCHGDPRGPTPHPDFQHFPKSVDSLRGSSVSVGATRGGGPRGMEFPVRLYLPAGRASPPGVRGLAALRTCSRVGAEVTFGRSDPCVCMYIYIYI